MVLLFIMVVYMVLVSLFAAGAIDNAVHYDGFWSGFKICMGSCIAYIIAQMFFVAANRIMANDTDKETDS